MPEPTAVRPLPPLGARVHLTPAAARQLGFRTGRDSPGVVIGVDAECGMIHVVFTAHGVSNWVRPNWLEVRS